jgi:hypothetical protein
MHLKKRFTSFPSPAGMSLTKLPLGRNNSVMTSLFPPRESLVVTSRLGTGNSRFFFYGVPAFQGFYRMAFTHDTVKNGEPFFTVYPPFSVIQGEIPLYLSLSPATGKPMQFLVLSLLYYLMYSQVKRDCRYSDSQPAS